MFKLRGGAKIEKAPNVDPAQLNLYKEFDAAEKSNDIPAEPYIYEIDNEDKEREEAMINETLTRNEWDRKMIRDNDSDIIEELSHRHSYNDYQRLEDDNKSNVVTEISKVREEIKNIAGETEEDDSEEDKPGYELYGRFARFKGQANGKSNKKLRR